MANLHQAVDSRVYVAVGRGLWDWASQDVYEYLEGLQQGLGLNKVQGPVSLHAATPVSACLCASCSRHSLRLV